MATVNFSKSQLDTLDACIVAAATLTGTDNTDSLASPSFSDRSVQITGTFNSGTVLIEGSNDGTNWVTLNDPLGNALSFTAAGLKQVSELTAYIRARASVAVTSVVVTMLCRKTL
jgi:hypothetical protein